MMTNGPVLVVGGTGMLGGQVVGELLSRGNGYVRWCGQRRNRNCSNEPAQKSCVET
jgi:hypothetical protein